ncbi:hypothetical protein KUCAC02_027062, partial [Chaenocephalus aceratus]
SNVTTGKWNRKPPPSSQDSGVVDVPGSHYLSRDYKACFSSALLRGRRRALQSSPQRDWQGPAEVAPATGDGDEVWAGRQGNYRVVWRRRGGVGGS